MVCENDKFEIPEYIKNMTLKEIQMEIKRMEKEFSVKKSNSSEDETIINGEAYDNTRTD